MHYENVKENMKEKKNPASKGSGLTIIKEHTFEESSVSTFRNKRSLASRKKLVEKSKFKN